MQAQPAIEFVSGEEVLRPKSYHIVFSFVEYAFTDGPKVCNGPWLLLWSRGGRRPSVTQCVVSLLPVTCCFSLKDVFKNLPRGQRLWWPELLMASFVRRTPLVGA